MARSEVALRLEQASPPPLLPPKKGWKARVGLYGILVGAVVLSVLGGGGAAGFHAFNILYQNKLTDTWAILFLNLERQSQRISDSIRQELQVAPNERPSILLRVATSGKLKTVRGELPGEVTTDSLGLPNQKQLSEILIAQFAGKDYLAKYWNERDAVTLMEEPLPSGDYLALWPVKLPPFFQDAKESSVSDLHFFATKGGKLLFSSRKDVTSVNFSDHEIVQRFISHPLRQGQVVFSREGTQWYGIFHEIPGTNIILFSETSSWMVLSIVKEKGMQFLIGLFLILAAVLILIQFPLSGVVAPIRELVRLVEEVAKGNFDVHPKRSAFGELSILSHAINDMGKRLMVRDQAIQELLVVQQEKIRMQNEMGLAQGIQANFLIESELPSEVGIEVASKYIPASEVGGDWFGYFYDENTGENIFAIADVTGHGAGPALFTAVIAGAFEEQVGAMQATSTPFPMAEFADRLNRLILNLGKGKVNATLQLACVRPQEEKVHLLNAGNSFPWIVSCAELATEPQVVSLRSDPLGASDQINVTTKAMPFPKGAMLLMFTDGLVEGRRDHTLYPESRMKKACEFSSHHTTKQVIDRLFEDWTDYLSGEEQNDDFCMLVVRAV